MAIALVATHNDTSITLTQVDRYLDDLRCIYISSHHNRVVSDKPQTIGTTKIYVFLGAATSSWFLGNFFCNRDRDRSRIWRISPWRYLNNHGINQQIMNRAKLVKSHDFWIFEMVLFLVGGIPWYTYPSEKYESQFGWWFPIYGNKKWSQPPTRFSNLKFFPATRKHAGLGQQLPNLLGTIFKSKDAWNPQLGYIHIYIYIYICISYVYIYMYLYHIYTSDSIKI